MSKRWLSFWNEDTRNHNRRLWLSQDGDEDLDHDVDEDRDRGEIYVPYGGGKISRGDVVYCVAIEGGELLLFGRVVVGRLDPDMTKPRELNLWSVPGTESNWRIENCAVDRDDADSVVYLRQGDMSEHHIARDSRSWLLGNAFQGHNSIRQLMRGYERLDRVIAERNG